MQTIIRTRVILVDGGSPATREKIGKGLTAVMQEMNFFAAGRGNDDSLRQHCTTEGFAALKRLIETTQCFSTIPEYRTNLLDTPNGGYEVRGLNVRVNMAGTQGDPVQYLVFELNALGKIISVNFAIEEKYYNQIMQQGRAQNDLFIRQVILDLMEEFRTAHNRKDLAYLENIYSDYALIIVGRVLEKRRNPANEIDDLALSNLNKKDIQFVKVSKQEYIERLGRVFQNNSFVKVLFFDFEIKRHPKYADIYGVNVRQRWSSSTYSDYGYLFLLIDFRNPQRPLIRVRSWQPKLFEDGSKVSLGNFEIIR
jgi:hypothetical protein